MSRSTFFESLGIKARDSKAISNLAVATGLSLETLRWMESERKLPAMRNLEAAVEAMGGDLHSAKVKLGIIDRAALAVIRGEPAPSLQDRRAVELPRPVFKTGLGTLYRADCIEIMKAMGSESVDMVFADPPFNLGKLYPSGMNDLLKEEEYFEWCLSWLDECVRILKFGGSLFIYNLPKWNIAYGAFLSERLNFRHSIAIDMKYSLPIPGRLYPSHYSLLYLIKGKKPAVFHPDRLPTETCPKCFGDLRDYGGYKDKMNPKGVNLTDVWTDIPPVRHARYKKREGANELSFKLLDRVIEISTNPGDVVFDPFGGSGTTYAVAEAKDRAWIGSEIGPVDGIIERLEGIEEEVGFINDHRSKLNALHPPDVKRERMKRGIWTADTFLPGTEVQGRLFK